MQKTFEITISGQVQGVGFRPFVYSLSKQFQLRGSVCNNQDGVLIHINASEEKATNFLVQLLENAPSISIIQSHKISENSVSRIRWLQDNSFRSKASNQHSVNPRFFYLRIMQS